jgi:ribosomal protein S16
MLGWYNPFADTNNCLIDADRLNYWLKAGAQISPNVRALLVRVAPAVAKELQEKENARRVKNAAKRRALKKA